MVQSAELPFGADYTGIGRRLQARSLIEPRLRAGHRIADHQTYDLYLSRNRTGFDSASRRNGSPSSCVTINSSTVAFPSV
jgi:hypothetical protein